MLGNAERERLIRFAQALVDQRNAKVIIEPQRPKSGFWFGGGNLIEAPDGNLYLVGRYRNQGDSRTGVGLGERGLELAVFKSSDRGASFEKLLSFQKEDLNIGDREVLSIEGSALRFKENGVELFVSTEKSNIPYPEGLEAFKKPGTGVWTIEHMQADRIENLRQAELHTILACDDPRWLHVKDPFYLEMDDGSLLIGFVTHPFNWTSYNAGYAIRDKETGQISAPVFDFFPRGFTWDVVFTRLTHWLRVPQMGRFAKLPPLTLLFYDGGEMVREPVQHQQGVERPRGYGCEEIGGLAFAAGDGIGQIERLSVNLPLFTSPMGTGCSRYVDVLETAEGFYATWQQSQEDLSQPLVMNFLSREEAEAILA